MQTMKKLISVVLCAALLCGTGVMAAAARETASVDYTIVSPYADVRWDAVSQYKTALHTHTNASDGSITLRESLETHVLQGFDLVATTDHGISNGSWYKPEDSNYQFTHTMLKLLDRTEGELDYLGNAGTFTNCGYRYTLETRDNGDDYLTVTTDAGQTRELMRIPYGIENNALSINAHVNSWFVPYCDNTLNDYTAALRGVTKAGGICVINHPGEYAKGKSTLTCEEAYNESNWAYRYYINRFNDLLRRYPSCIGIDVNSKGDSRTRYDRQLWDKLLERNTCGVRNVFAICSSDAHQADKINTGYTRLLMTEKTSAAARKALETGAFFGCSYCNGNRNELANIVEYLEKYYGTDGDFYAVIQAGLDALDARIEGVRSGTLDADAGPADPVRLIDKSGYFHGKDTFVTAIDVDDDADTITLHTDNALLVRWIANGKVIAVSKADGGVSTLHLRDYADEIGTYVRAEAIGEGGFIYTQPFMLSYAGQPAPQNYFYLPIPIVDALFADLRTLFTTLGRVFANWLR